MTTVSTILLSYNRPRMLCEALSTCLDCDQLIVTDDGSDFDVQALVRSCRPDAQFVTAPKMTTAERLVTPRLGGLINRALALVTCDVVTYLCDDDLFHPQWLPSVRAWFDQYPDQHWARGAWYTFEEGEHAQERCPLDGRQLTTGNFAHRAACYRDEGVHWDETTVASHDNAFLWSAARHHDMYRVPYIPVVAGWRRLHKHNALPYAAGHDYAPGAAALFAGGMLE